MTRRLSEIQPLVTDKLSQAFSGISLPVLSTLGTRDQEKAIEAALEEHGMAVVVAPIVYAKPNDLTAKRSQLDVLTVVALKTNQHKNEEDGLDLDPYEILEEIVHSVQAIDPQGQKFELSEDGIQLNPEEEGLLVYNVILKTSVTI